MLAIGRAYSSNPGVELSLTESMLADTLPATLLVVKNLEDVAVRALTEDAHVLAIAVVEFDGSERSAIEWLDHDEYSQVEKASCRKRVE